ncbi:MAG: SprB repeat-containing protein [Bacteroidetes bacterium]|nr:SprB repeat-containing protein [Bacteroidota bacterium]
MSVRFFLFIVISFTCIAFIGNAQPVTVTNNSVTITNSNERITIKGSYTNLTTGYVVNTGTVEVSGNILNNSVNEFSDSSAGKFVLNGKNSLVGGSHALNFYKLEVKVSDTVFLSANIKVLDTVFFSRGFIKLNNQTVYLDSTGNFYNERDTSRVFGLTGKVQLVKQLSAPDITNNISGVGLHLQSQNNHGYVVIERSHSQQLAGDTSVFRFFKIAPQFVAPIDSVRVKYFAGERYKNETNYKIFTSLVTGTGAGSWVNRNGLVDNVDKGVGTKLNSFLLDSVFFTIANQSCAAAPDINVQGFPVLTVTTSVYTITCANDTATVTAYSSAPAASIHWKNAQGVLFSNPLVTNVQGAYNVEVINGINGCAKDMWLQVTQNKIPPLLNALQDSAFLTCSFPSLQLLGSSITPQTMLDWYANNSVVSANPATVNATGIYNLVATRADNGCTATDSIHVGYKPIISFQTTNDTLVCKNASVMLNAAAVGALGAVSYSWSTGAASASISVNTANTAAYVVSATASGGCFGSDTVVVSIPSDIVDSAITFQSCDGTRVGTIQLYASGGIPPYRYSIDNGVNYQSVNTFADVAYGTYNVVIKDSLSCLKARTAVVNGYSSLPVPQFIASTHNFSSDTIVLVDLSVPQADSVKWILPAAAQIIGGTMFNPIVYMPDTGVFNFGMIGYFANCTLDTNKTIRFVRTDTTFATKDNYNGIKRVELYPNPSNGIFTVEVELYKKQNVTIQAWDAYAVRHLQTSYSEVETISLPVNLSLLQNGTYIIRVIGEYDTRHLYFIISR